jgi:hypothetical protein
MNEKLTVILFKNHLTSRTFEVSLKKLERIGISFVVVIFLAIFSSVFFVRSGLKMLRTKDAGNAERTEILERQLSELKTSYEALQAHLSGSTAAGSNLSQSSLRSVLFTSIPTNSVRSPIPSRDSLPFRLEGMKSRWQGNFLYISTAIEYTRGDEGTQQGNFFIVAHGPQNLYAHPEGAFSDAGSETLMDPESGEYFSVARYREIRARFGPVERRDQIESISIYLFDRNKNLIYLDRINLKDTEPSAGASAPAASGPAPIAPRRVMPVPPAPRAPEADPLKETESNLKKESPNESENKESSAPGSTGN